MASNNSLLGMESTDKKKEAEVEVKPVKLYREDYLKGRVFEGEETIKMMRGKGWSERKKPQEVEVVQVKKSKIDVSGVIVKKPKLKTKGKK